MWEIWMSTNIFPKLYVFKYWNELSINLQSFITFKYNEWLFRSVEHSSAVNIINNWAAMMIYWNKYVYIYHCFYIHILWNVSEEETLNSWQGYRESNTLYYMKIESEHQIKHWWSGNNKLLIESNVIYS